MGTLKSYVENKKRLSEKEGKLVMSVFDRLCLTCCFAYYALLLSSFDS